MEKKSVSTVLKITAEVGSRRLRSGKRYLTSIYTKEETYDFSVGRNTSFFARIENLSKAIDRFVK